MDNLPLTFYTLNARGLNTYKKRVALFDWFKDVKFDIIFLQETHFIKKMNIFIIQGGLVISTMLCLTLCLVEGCQFFLEKILIWISFIIIILQMADFYYSMLISMKNALTW